MFGLWSRRGPAAASEDRSFEPGYAMSKQYVAVTVYKILRDHAPDTIDGCERNVKDEPDRFNDLGTAGAFTRGSINCLDKLGYLQGLPGGSASGPSFEPGYAMSKQYVAVTVYKILRDHAPDTIDGCERNVKDEPDRFNDLGAAGAFTRGSINCLDKLGYLDGLPGGSQNPDAGSMPATYKAISAARWHSCAIGVSGEAVCWGANDYGKADAPAGKFTAISAGDRHSCAIGVSGEAVCWGLNHAGQADAPAGKFTAISAGDRHSCAIGVSGEAVCWGTNDDGQADAPAGKFTAISAAAAHSCAIRVSGEAVCWGLNHAGQADAPAGKFTAISAARWHSCAIRVSGEAVCWGANDDGQADAPAGKFTAISAGDNHSCAIRVSGEAVCWGDNYYGQADAPAGKFHRHIRRRVAFVRDPGERRGDLLGHQQRWAG